MSYNPCCFDRNEYLAHEDIFEPLELTDASQELSEFNSNVESLAFELAYTRYHLAKLEAHIDGLRQQVPKVVKPNAPSCPDKHYTLFTQCPECAYGGIVYQTNEPYGEDMFCPKCGARFDWSEGGEA